VSSSLPMPAAEFRTRPLGAADLDAVAAMDAAATGQPRRRYLERRLAQAKRFPELHAQFAVEAGGALAGFVLGRLLEGEFGRTDPGLRLEDIGVREDHRGRGAGRALMAALEAWARRRGVQELRTTALWTQHAMLQFLDAGGWRLARTDVIDCAIGEGELGTAREAPVASPDDERTGDANDYSAPSANDFEALARDLADVRALKADDLEGVARIDRRHTGGDRTGFLRHALDEALGEGGVRVSLAAIVDGALAGFAMARVDLGDFGRSAPVAILDTVGVDPLHKGKGIGRALLSQLFVNLGALRVERVETVVDPRNLELLGFFVRAGFGPADRLAFVKPLA
jgi:GNAT superfamily N-acetyltransferase